jgi:hypothetical protein
VRRSEWEWQQSDGTMHAALIRDSRYRFCPNDEIHCVCGADLVLSREDFPCVPEGNHTCGKCLQLLSTTSNKTKDRR